MTPNLYALLVGIDKYLSHGNNLNGCVNDIKEVEEFIKNRLKYNSHIEKLIDKQATRQNVIEKFESHLCQAGKDDVVLFYFCGHGAQEEAGQELHFLEYEKEPGKKKLETIVCHDSRTRSEDDTEIHDLADKELRYLISKVAKNEPHILVVFDCCHSSSGTRDTDRKEGVRRTDSRPPRKYEEFCFAHDPQIQQDLENKRFPEGKHIFISACLHTETAKEISEKERGVFSYFLLQELNSLNATLSYNDLLREVSSRVHGYRRDQTPQLEPIGMTFEELNKMSFLGDKEVIKPRDPYFILSRRDRVSKEGQLIQDAEWVINGGAFLHLQKDSKLAVYRQHSTADEMKNEENKLGEIKITNVRVTESVVKFTSRPESNDSIFYAVLTERQLPSVSFYLEGDEEVLKQVKELLKDSPFVGIEDDRNQTHHYRLYADNQQFRITDDNDRLLVEPIEGYDVNLAVKQVEHIARWRKTRDMENPSTSIPKDAIEIEIFHNGKRLEDPVPRLEYQYKDGTWEEPTIQLKLKNTSQQSLYCTILDIADDYSVSFPGILPEGGDLRNWIPLQPKQEYLAKVKYDDGSESQDIPLVMPEEVLEKGVTEYQDLFKLVASTTPFNDDLNDFIQNSLSLAEPQERQLGKQRKLPKLANDDWITTQFSLTCVRPKDSVKLTPEAETTLSSGITIKAPPGLSASARFKTTKSATRSMSSVALPSLLDETEAFKFTTSRSLEQGLDVLELQVDTSTINAVTPDSPMIISVKQPLQPNERILAVADDGQFYFPLGIGQAENDKTEIKIEYLCDPQGLNSDEREIRQAIQLCFRKVVLDNLGRKSSYAWLRKATVNEDGKVSYTDKEDIDTVKVAVAKAKNIVLYIHGIIGDTESMIPSVRHAKVNVKEQVKSVEELYDLVLAFDYESLNTPIEETAKILKNQLAAVGLTPNHGKTLHIVAHSMGGLVSRSFIEQGNGNEVVSHLIMVGTPNGGSPWATVHDLATTLLSFGLNLSYVPLVPSLLKKLVGAMSVTLRAMHPTKSSFFSELKTSVSSRCPYSIIAGSTALINQAADAKHSVNALKNKLRRAIEFPFGDEENDIAVAVSSIIDVPQDGSYTVNILDTIACDHLSYFQQAEGLNAIAKAISQAFGYPPEPLPPGSSSSPGPRPNPSPGSSGRTGAQPTGKSSTNTSKERTPGSSASTSGKSSVFANTLASQTQLSLPQKNASVSPQINPNHETRTTKWFDTTHVVAIGINQYTRPIARLENAVSDAEKICQLFSQKHLLSKEPVKHYKLLDKQATLDGIRQNLESLKTEVKESDRLILYFAGHGIALPMEIVENAPSNKPQGYLIPQDAEYDKLESYLSMSEFIQSLSDIQCRHCLIILDCCYAGAIRWSLGQYRQVLHKKVFPSVLDLYIDSPAWQILTSAAEDQTANDVLHHHQLKENNRDSNGKSNSPFVSFLEKGLNGAADYPPKDGIITINELITYLDSLEILTNEAQKRQTAQLCDFPPEKHKRGKFVFLLGDFAEVREGLGKDPEISNEDNPYRGLESYSEHDGAVFFGREQLIEKLSEHVQSNFFTIVLGQSGAGKSSLVKAGLVPKLRKISEETERAQQSNSEEKTTQQSESKAPPVKWVAEIFRPSSLPGTALEKALKALEEAVKKLDPSNIPDNTKRLLVIDQFEEVETQCRDEKEKNNFWNKLIEQLKNPSNKLHLVFTLRSGFETTLRSKFENAIKEFDHENDINWVSARFIVPDMEREELQDVIEKPAKEKAVFFTLDPDPNGKIQRTLVQQLVHEVAGMPGALPLLSFALYTMYRNFVERYMKAEKEQNSIKPEITWNDYGILGVDGVPGSLRKRATEEYDRLGTPDRKNVLRWVMLRMISLQAGELARRQVPKSELEYPEKENKLVQEVIDSFLKACLIVEGSNSQGKYYEPAHDTLVQNWDKVLEWKNQELETLVLQQRLKLAVDDWQNANNKENKNLNFLLKQLLLVEFYIVNKIQSKNRKGQRKKEPHQKTSRPNICAMAAILCLPISPLLSLALLDLKSNRAKDKTTTNKSEEFLWHNDPRLPQLNEKLDTESSWLNKNEDKFVRHSLVKKVRDAFWRRSVANLITAIIVASGLWALWGQRQAQIGQIRAFRESAEANLRSNNDLEATLNILRAKKGLRELLPFGWFPDTIEETELQAKLHKVLYDVRERNRLQINRASVNEVALSPDGKRLVTAVKDTVTLWDTSNGNQIKSFSAMQTDISDVAFHPTDSNIFATAGTSERLVRLWKIENNRNVILRSGNVILRSEMKTDHPVYSIAFINNDKIAAIEDDDQNNQRIIRIWDILSGKKDSELLIDEKKVIDSGENQVPTKSEPTSSKTPILNKAKPALKKLFQDNKATFNRLTRSLDSVKDLSFSPKNNLLAIVGEKNKVRLCSIVFQENQALLCNKTQLEEKTYEIGTKTIPSVAFDSDGNLAVVGEDGQIKQWNKREIENNGLKSKPIEIPTEQGILYGVALSKDIIATFRFDFKVVLRDRFGKEIRSVEPPARIYRNNSIALSPDGSLLATAGDDRYVQLWDPSGKRIKRISIDLKNVSNLTFASTGEKLFIRADDGKCQEMSIPGDLTLVSEPETACQSKSENIIKTQIQKWKKFLEKQSKKYEDLKPIKSFALTADGMNIVIGDKDGTVWQWDDSIKELIPLLQTQQGSIYALALTPNKTLVTLGEDGTLRIWDLRNQQIQVPQVFKEDGSNIAFSSDGTKLATVGEDGHIKLWDTSGNLLKHISMMPYTPLSIAFSPHKNENLLIVGAESGVVKLFDIAGKQIDVATIPEGGNVTSLSWSSDDKLLVITEKGEENLGKTKTFWEGRIIKEEKDNLLTSKIQFYTQSPSLQTATLSKDSKLAVVTQKDQNTVSIWDKLDTESQNYNFQTQQGGVVNIAFSSDGKLLATTGEDGSLRLGDTSGRLLDLVATQQTEFTGVAFSLDGRMLATIGRREQKPTTKLWKISIPENKLTLFKTLENVSNIAFSPDGRLMATGQSGANGKLEIWQIGNTDELLAGICSWVESYLEVVSDSSDRNLCNGVASPVAQVAMSIGDKILTPNTGVGQKQAGVEAIANGNFKKAADILDTYINQNSKPNDPEALIYRNNAEISRLSLPSYTIAVSVPMSSDPNGALEMLRGVAQAQHIINNKNGGINGRNLQVLIADDKNDPELAKQIAEKLSNNPNVLGVIGHYASDTTLATREIYTKSKLPAISPVSTSVKLSGLNLLNWFGRYTFRTVPSDKHAALKLAEYMRNNYLQSKAIVFYNSQSEYSNSLTNEFVNDIGSSKVSKKIDLSDPNFDAAKSIEQVEPGTVLVLMPNVEKLDKALMVVEENAKRPQRLPMLAGDDVYSPTTLERERGESTQGMVIAVPWHIGLHRQEPFVQGSINLWGNRDVNWRTAMSYDATQALIAAIKQNPTREGVAQVLRSNQFQINNSATGEVSFSSSGDRNQPNIQLVEIQPGSRSGSGYDFVPVGANFNQ